MNNGLAINETLQKEIKEKYGTMRNEARCSIMKDMLHRGYGAIVWGANVFGSTDYPLIDRNGRAVSLKGFRLEAQDKLVAITGLPDALDVVGVRAFTPMEADKVLGTMSHDQGYYTSGGTPEEWEIAADCYKVALKTLEAQKEEHDATTWW